MKMKPPNMMATFESSGSAMKSVAMMRLSDLTRLTMRRARRTRTSTQHGQVARVGQQHAQPRRADDYAVEDVPTLRKVLVVPRPSSFRPTSTVNM